MNPLACSHVLGDDDRLSEEVVGELDVQRQVEPDRASADIGAPTCDVRIVLQHEVELGRDLVARVDRSVLREGQIDDELRPVRGWEELPRHKRHGQQREHETGKRERHR